MKQKHLWPALCVLTGAGGVQAQTDERPNILLIMSDDMGYSDIGCYGGVLETPHLDRLAEQGIRYTQFYNTARSCPSRASLMTGLHPHQTGIGHMTDDRVEAGYRGDLNNECVTIGEVLQSNGYETFAVGKWHMTRFMKQHSPKHNWPLQRGFDHFYGTIAGGGSFYDPQTLCRGNTYITPENDPEYRPDTFYYTNAITDNALRFLQGRDADEKPFFMYVAYTAAHWPMHALEEDIRPYRGKFDEGWDALRAEKYERMKALGIIDPEWPLGTDSTVVRWDDAEHKAFEAQCMEVYAAMVSNMDENIGRLVTYLEETGQLDNTLIIYLQDNGACEELIGRGPKQPVPIRVPAGAAVVPMTPDELQTRLTPYRTRNGRPVWEGRGVVPGGADTYIAYGKGWAHASNTPFREYKHWVHEGGIAAPLIMHWPARIRQQQGEMRRQPGQLPDIMATLVDASQSVYPATYKGHAIQPCEGRSLLPAIEHDNFMYDRPLFWEHEGNRAVRTGKWKLVYKAGTQQEDIPHTCWELYDLEADRTEMNNVAAKHPRLVKRMARLWEEFAVRCRVKPWPHPIIGPENH